VLRLHFLNANPAVALASDDALPGRVNYFLGNDPAAWRTGIPTYARLTYRDLYPGVDLDYAGSAPTQGTYTSLRRRPARIRWRYEGASAVNLDSQGNLQIHLPTAQHSALSTQDSAPSTQHFLTEQAPVAWQDIDGRRVPVDVRYVITADGSIGFALGGYDRARPLVIDPVLVVYSTYLGGSGYDEADGITVDAVGSAYVTGSASSIDFPLQNPFQGTYGGGCDDAFVTKFNPSGTALVYSTYAWRQRC
jgi:hypothetical protein